MLLNSTRSASVARPLLTIGAARVNTIGIANRDLRELFNSMDAGDGKESVARRDFARWPFRHASIVLRMVHPGGTEVEIRVACRNLSRGGISLLHNGFAYPGTACRVLLPSLWGDFEEISGILCRCAHRKGTLHELGVKFTKQVDLSRYIDASQSGDFHSIERVKPESLKGRMLLVESCPPNQRIVHHYLRESAIKIVDVASAKEALEAMCEEFDLLLTNRALPDMSGTKLIAQIRTAGINTPAIIATSDRAAVVRDGYGDLINVGLITMPMTHELLLRAVAERLLLNPQRVGEQSKPRQARELDVNPELVAEMRRNAEKLREIASGKDIAAALTPCIMFRAIATSVGHPAIGAAASKVVDAMTTGKPIEQQRVMLAELARIACLAMNLPPLGASELPELSKSHKSPESPDSQP